MQKTNQQNAQTKAQMARYEDELARKRMEVRVWDPKRGINCRRNATAR
jgi:hypothetical protein